jgi:hypothetical protein
MAASNFDKNIGFASSLVRAARDRDRGVRLGPHAAHVEAAIAHRDVVAGKKSHPFDTARSPIAHVVFRQREDDSAGTSDELEKSGRRLAARGLGEELVRDVAAGATERDFLRQRVRQVDHIGRGLADREVVDLVLELDREIVAAIGAGEGRT